MAPNHRHGKNAVVLFNQVNLSTTLNDASMDASVDTADVTCFGHDDRVYIPGQRDAVASWSGFLDGSTDQVDETVATALGGSTYPVVTWGPLGGVAGRPALLAKGVATNHAAQSPAGDAVTVSLAMQVSGGPEGRQSGVWLHDVGTASTSTGAGSTITHGSTATSGSTWGAVAHLHVISETTSTGTVIVQDSSDGSGWTDLITFTFSSGASVQRSTVSGEVKEKVRYNISALSTAGATLGLAVARNRAST